MSGSQNRCARCAGTTRSGEQCKNRTCIYSKYCNQHTNDVIIKKSTLPGDSGKGLFAKRPFEKGETIGLYTGERMTRAQFDAQIPESDYGIEPKKNYVIDGKDTQKSSNMRNINDGRTKKKNNARFSTNFRSHPLSVSVKATRKINRLREILVSYGPNYWR